MGISKNLKCFVLFILLVGLLLRFYNLNAPILDHHSIRQVDTAAFARNFSENGMNLLYPQFDGGGPQGFVECEFPLYSYTVAALYKLFGIHEALGRLVSILFSLGTTLVLFKLVRDIYDWETALVSSAVFAILPLSIVVGRSVQPESVMLFGSVLSIYCCHAWLKRDNKLFYCSFILSISLTLLVKLPTLYLGLPILFLLLRERGGRFLYQPPVLLGALIALGATSAWYVHAHNLFLEYGNTFTFIPNKFADLSLLLDPKFYAQIFVNRLGGIVLTPLGYILMVMGLLLPVEKQEHFLFHYWFLAIIIYFFIVGQGNLFHDYYQYPILPVASVFIGRSLIAAMRGTLFSRATIGNKVSWFLSGWNGPALIGFVFGIVTLANLFEITFKQQRAMAADLGDNITLAVLVAGSAFLVASVTVMLNRKVSTSKEEGIQLFCGLSLAVILVSGLFFVNLNGVYAQDLKMLYIGEEIAATTNPDDLIVVTTDSSLGQLYYAHRKGWGYFRTLPGSSRELERLRRQGARAFVTDQREKLGQRPDLLTFLGKASHRDLGNGYEIYFLQPYEQ